MGIERFNLEQPSLPVPVVFNECQSRIKSERLRMQAFFMHIPAVDRILKPQIMVACLARSSFPGISFLPADAFPGGIGG